MWCVCVFVCVFVCMGVTQPGIMIFYAVSVICTHAYCNTSHQYNIIIYTILGNSLFYVTLLLLYYIIILLI